MEALIPAGPSYLRRGDVLGTKYLLNVSSDSLPLESCPGTWPALRQPTSRFASVNRPPHDQRMLRRQGGSNIAAENSIGMYIAGFTSFEILSSPGYHR